MPLYVYIHIHSTTTTTATIRHHPYVYVYIYRPRRDIYYLIDQDNAADHNATYYIVAPLLINPTPLDDYCIYILVEYSTDYCVYIRVETQYYRSCCHSQPDREKGHFSTTHPLCLHQWPQISQMLQKQCQRPHPHREMEVLRHLQHFACMTVICVLASSVRI